jgi:leader peptidase (prepilin peptidase) / N-methyltransferase
MFESVVILFLLGLSLGSFVNVCIYRLPRGISVVYLRSFCPHCQNIIDFPELIPVLGFLIAGGRCKSCSSRISFLYPIIELFVASVTVFVFYQKGISLSALVLMVFFLLMLTIALIDWKYLIIPNQIVIVGVVAGFLIKGLSGETAFIDSLLASFISFLTLLVVMLLGNIFLKKPSMGGGDVKLAAVIGLFLGYWDFMIALWLASIVGTVFGLMRSRIGNAGFPMSYSQSAIDSKLPFGSFLAATSVFILFFQQQIQGLIDTWLIWNL